MSLLDARLRAVLALIPPGSVLLDIGTDHCKLPAEGLLSGRLAGAFAADLREGPLQAARRQLAALNLEARIPLYLSDGLKQIPPAVLDRVTAVSVAGMGGELIAAIMAAAPAEPPLWVLQPMTGLYELIDSLQGYTLAQGSITQDGAHFYLAFTAVRRREARRQDYFAPFRGSPLLGAYLEKEERRLLAAHAGLHRAAAPDQARIAAAEKLLAAVRKAKNDYCK